MKDVGRLSTCMFALAPSCGRHPVCAGCMAKEACAAAFNGGGGGGGGAPLPSLAGPSLVRRLQSLIRPAPGGVAPAKPPAATTVAGAGAGAARAPISAAVARKRQAVRSAFGARGAVSHLDSNSARYQKGCRAGERDMREGCSGRSTSQMARGQEGHAEAARGSPGAADKPSYVCVWGGVGVCKR